MTQEEEILEKVEEAYKAFGGWFAKKMVVGIKEGKYYVVTYNNKIVNLDKFHFQLNNHSMIEGSETESKKRVLFLLNMTSGELHQLPTATKTEIDRVKREFKAINLTAEKQLNKVFA